ncbi:BnaA04g12470D [Brassica napus]|uniref:BnaA04g12470D protein n=1 Tax=Brassica napus TaxID=3708 RepID=A0A078FSH4_BRANA|nr:BnaA04g12470D [Brassica napus]
MYFNDISPGRSESQLRFRLIHFWEARNIAKARAFLGLELLLIDEHGTVMQGFISSNRAETYRPHLKAGATYTLQIFFATRSKEIYRVVDQSLTISFSNGSVLAPLDDDDIPVSVSFPADRFRFHTHDDFQANRGLRGDLYDISTNLQKNCCRCRWPLEAGEWTVTRVETMTIGQIFAYIKQEYAKEASFDCIATIDDVERDSAWYYIACGGCQTKATRGPSSLMCAKCGNTNAVFILLGDAGTELTGKQAAELVDNYFENLVLAIRCLPPPPSFN